MVPSISQALSWGRFPVWACAVRVERGMQADSRSTERDLARKFLFAWITGGFSLHPVWYPKPSFLFANHYSDPSERNLEHTTPPLETWLLSCDSPKRLNSPQRLLPPFASFVYHNAVSCSTVVGLLKAVSRNVSFACPQLISFMEMFKGTAFSDKHIENQKHPSDF